MAIAQDPASPRARAAAVRRAVPAEAPQLAATLAAAFSDDPVLGWLIPSDRRRQRALERFFAVELAAVGFARGAVWTTDALDGAAIVAPPGAWRLPWSTTLRHGPDFARVFGARLPHATALLSLMERRHVREPHHYFPYIGVAPAAQGRGLGTALMRPTLERCDEAGLPAYLEASSERNARLYARLGFEPLDEIRLGGSPPLLRMLRPPGG